MNVTTHLDVVDVTSDEVEEAIRALVREKTGREMARIISVYAMDQSLIGVRNPFKLVTIKATLKPESK